MSYNLIIVDDHKMFLDGLSSIFNAEKGYNILITAKNGASVIKYLKINQEEKIDLVIMDITMPEVDGIALNTFVKQHRPDIKTLILSMHTDPAIIDNLIENNVDGYVPKNAHKEELFTAVQTILKGKKFFSREIMDVYMENKFSEEKNQEIKLTRREIDVITLIAKEYTTQEIADKLLLSKHTIESYRKNLISKLNVRNLAGLTKYAIKMNYV